MMLVVESRRPHCWNCKQISHLAKACSQKNIQTIDTTKEKPPKEVEIEVSNPVSEAEDPPSSENGCTQVTRKKEKNRGAIQSSDSQSSDYQENKHQQRHYHPRKTNWQKTPTKDSSIETPMETIWKEEETVEKDSLKNSAQIHLPNMTPTK